MMRNTAPKRRYCRMSFANVAQGGPRTGTCRTQHASYTLDARLFSHIQRHYRLHQCAATSTFQRSCGSCKVTCDS